MTHSLAIRGRFLTLLAVAFAGCKELPPPPPTPDTAEVRLLHASPDAPPLDLYVGGDKLVFGNVGYGNATSFQTIGVGSQRVLLTRAGDPQDQLFEAQIDVKPGEEIDLVAAGEAATTLHVVVLHENNTPPDAGTARLRVLNASPDGTPISVDLGNDGSIELPDLEPFHDSGEQGLEIRAGSILQLGVIRGADRIGSFILPPTPSGGNLLIVPTGYVARDPAELQGLALLAPGIGLVKQVPTLYFLHLVNFSGNPKPSLDVYGFTGLVSSDLRFGELVQIPVAEGSSASACLHAVSPRFCFGIGTDGLEPGHAQLELVRLKVESFFSHLFLETFSLVVSDPQLRFINAAFIPGISVGLMDDGEFTIVDGYAQLGYFDTSVIRTPVFSPGSHTLGVQLSGTSTIYRYEMVLNSGSRAFAIFGPSEENATGPSIYLVDTATQPWGHTVLVPTP